MQSFSPDSYHAVTCTIAICLCSSLSLLFKAYRLAFDSDTKIVKLKTCNAVSRSNHRLL